ncbi:MAG: 2,4-dihydroxyhept-2-ene-1,7-dioic acid aldolase [Candidatus Omnitrophica bacterium]|nr:2,4-dihydroxyhept-2-ene-1,7-dioic acid aldolase [Candidatus Omnitrophota bacterium]
MGLKQDLRKKGKVILGSWLQIGHPVTAEIMSQAGFEWLAVDLEHSVIELSQMQTLFQVMTGCGVTPLARVASNDPVQIKKVMDAGASGIIVPNVNSRDEAARAVSAAKYPPLGTRGVGLARAQKYGADFKGYYERINEESVVIAQIEHRLGVERLEEIVTVRGLDGLFIGPFDLSASYGIAGNFDHPLMKNAMERIERCARRANLALGAHVVYPNLNEVKKKIKQGYRLIAYSVDTILLRHYSSEAAKEIRRFL